MAFENKGHEGQYIWISYEQGAERYGFYTAEDFKKFVSSQNLVKETLTDSFGEIKILLDDSEVRRKLLTYEEKKGLLSRILKYFKG